MNEGVASDAAVYAEIVRTENDVEQKNRGMRFARLNSYRDEAK
jgi:hypothetical protein